MQLKHVKTAIAAQADIGLQKITAIAWSPNHLRMAVVSATNKTIFLYDENGDLKDKFPTKPSDPKGPKSFVVRAMAFSPDSSKLAIAQSDNMVWVYRLGAAWGEKKSICNKYPQTSSVTCLTWPSSHANELFFGLGEGKVKMGNLRQNKSVVIYTTEDYVVSICSNIDGNALIAGHIDGAIYIFSVSSTGSVTKAKLAQHPSIPYCLSWGESIMVAGNDRKVFFYEYNANAKGGGSGGVMQRFDYTHDDTEKEYTVAEFSASGQSVVVGSFNRFRTFTWSTRRKQWEESNVTEFKNLYSVTALAWKKDGSRLALGSLCGGVELYDAILRRYKYKGKFEMTYVSPSQVTVKRLSTGERLMLKSMYGYEVTKVNVFNDRFLTAHTISTLIMGDLLSKKKLISEMPWQQTGNERFFFDNPGVCMVVNAGEITLVEYGSNEPLGTCTTEHCSPHLISVRINEKKSEAVDSDEATPAPAAGQPPNKKIAYLLDLQTIYVMDLVTKTHLATVNHDAKIDWLELNPRATKLLFRDRRRCLNLFDIATQTRTTLLTLCSYVQWVPRADVVVAQSRNDLCVWYSIDAPDKVTMFPIKGDVIDIERDKGRSEVVIDEGSSTSYLPLNEPLIAFGSAVEEKKFEKASDILENLPITPESESMWGTLAVYTLEAKKLHIAERCFAALGNMPKAKYLRKLNQICRYAEKELQIVPGSDYYAVRCKLEILDKKFSKAEAIFLEQGQVEGAMEMYQELHKWDDCLRVAETYNHPMLSSLRSHYYQWLVDTKQEERAALLKEREGDYFEAIALYLKGGLPAKAAGVMITNNLMSHTEIMERIAESLYVSNLSEKAGFFFEKLGNFERSLDSYRRGHAFRAAVELSRSYFPQKVITLEEEWGEWLVSIGQVDQAINHFIEAGQYPRAIEAAIESKQWNKAVTIVDGLEQDTAKKYYKQIGRHYEETLNYDLAEKYYVKGSFAEDAVEMYTKANMWDAAHKIAVSYMSERDVTVLYLNQAQRLESKERFKEAEKLYITVGEQDQAINMYKKSGKFDDMIRLVTTYHKDLLSETHLHLAQQLEAEGKFKQAEHHYVAGGDWKSAVNMYRANGDMWEEAMRVAKQHGGANASTQVACVWARSIGGESGVNMLLKFGLIEQAVDYAIESGQFKKAEEICRSSLKKKLVDVYLKHAMALEDEGNFIEAEAEFIKAGSPKDAIDMYIHQHDWMNATRVAESFDPQSLYDILEAQAKVAMEKKEYQQAEKFFILARKPEEAVKMYKERDMWNEAVRVTKEHMSDKMPQLEDEGKELNEIQKMISNGDYSRAIDMLLKKTPENTSDMDKLEEEWETAVKLAMNHVQERVSEVVRTVSKRLVEIKRYAAAAELLEGIDAYKEAIDVYIQGEMWDQARALAASKAPEYTGGVADTKLSALIDRGDWDRALEIAQSQGQEVLGKYSAMRASQQLQEQKYLDAVNVFVKWGAVPMPENFSLYKTLTRTILGLPLQVDTEDTMKALRKMLFKLVASLKESGDIPSNVIEEFDRLSFIVHLVALKDLCKHQGLTLNTAKIATSMLRYSGDIPSDKTYYEAGIACKEVGALNMAFVFLNRYLDLCEAIDDASASILENADFENTDVPYDIPLPSRHSISSDRIEDVRSWILQQSLDQSHTQQLSTRTCETCSTEIYEASLTCHQCKSAYECCVVTGYPILRSSKINCTSCGKAANREDWNKYLSKYKSCPWCEHSQSPSY